MTNIIYVGIDPDVEKSGIAIFQQNRLTLSNMDYFPLFEYLRNLQQSCIVNATKLIVVIEKGQENKHLFKANNYYKNSNLPHNAKLNGAFNVAKDTGRNFEATDIIEKFCIFNSISYEFFVPNKQTPEISKEKFKLLFPYIKQSNDNTRDAVRCIIRKIF